MNDDTPVGAQYTTVPVIWRRLADGCLVLAIVISFVGTHLPPGDLPPLGT